jgi:DNA-binding NtrC family response regulator
VPSLNERKEDIPLLAESFVKEICEDYGMPVKHLTPDAMKELQKINWTGNIRELRNVAERLVILSDKKITDKDVVQFASK